MWKGANNIKAPSNKKENAKWMEALDSLTGKDIINVETLQKFAKFRWQPVPV